jgi:hypothetical protein
MFRGGKMVRVLLVVATALALMTGAAVAECGGTIPCMSSVPTGGV